MITCPICGLRMKRVARSHFEKHGLTSVQFHVLLIEAEHQRPAAEFLRDIYITQQLESPEIFRRYGLTYRMLRDLLALYAIPLRSRSEAVKATWSKDDGSRKIGRAHV